MLSAGNIAELEQLGYHYIIGSRLAKTPYETEEYLCAEGSVLENNQIFASSMVVRILAPIRTGVVSVNGVSLSIKPLIPDDVALLLKKLKV